MTGTVPIGGRNNRTDTRLEPDDNIPAQLIHAVRSDGSERGIEGAVFSQLAAKHDQFDRAIFAVGRHAERGHGLIQMDAHHDAIAIGAGCKGNPLNSPQSGCPCVFRENTQAGDQKRCKQSLQYPSPFREAIRQMQT